MKKEQFFSHYITKILISQTSFKDLLMNIQQMHVALGIKCIKHMYCLDIDRLQHGYINILILMTKITLFNLHGNLGKFYKKIQKLHNLKKIGSQI